MNTETLKNANARIEEFRTELEFLGPPDVVAALLARVRAWARTTLDMIADLKKDVCADYSADYGKWNGAEPQIKMPADASDWGWTLRASAFAAMLLECGFAAILAALTFNLPSLPAALTGILITVVITLVFKGVWRILCRDEHRPRKGVRTLSLQLLVVFPAWLLALTGALLLGRTLTEATPVANLVFITLMTVLTVLSPMLAAILFTFSELQGWARKHARQWRALEKLELDVHELEAYCDAVQGRLAGEPQNKPQSSVGSAGRSLAPAAVALLLLVCAAPLRASTCRNQLWVDFSRSPSSAERRSAVESSLALLPRLAESECGQEWDLFGFAGAGFSATAFHIISLPKRQTGAGQVQASKIEMDRVFRNLAKQAAAERQQQCDEIRQREALAYQSAIDSQISQAREELARFKVPDAGRTCIVDLLLRLSETAPRRALVLTDGEETCARRYRGPIPAPERGTAVIMVIVSQERSKTAETPRQYYLRMKDKWLKVAPWINVVPIYGIEEKIFDCHQPGGSRGINETRLNH